MRNLISKIWKAIVGIPHKTEQETYCQMRRREKREEALRDQEKKPEEQGKGGFAY